jgi:hypothetical protein
MSNKNIAKIARDAFAEGAISLLRRALADGLGAHILVDPHGVMTHADLFDADGAAMLELKLNATQLALPLEPAAVPAPVEPPVPAVDRVAPVRRVLRVGDHVAERLAHGATRVWTVTAVNLSGPTMHDEGFHEEVTWAHISYDDAAGVWRLSSEHDPVLAASSSSDGRPVDDGAVNGVRIGDRLILDGFTMGLVVEVLGVDRDGFIWRTTDANPDDRDEGETLWSDVRHVGGNTWVSRKVTTPVEADELDEEPAPAPAPPPKPKRARKPRAPKAAPSTEPAAPVPHRLQAVTEADELAHRGEHSLIGLRGGEWLTLATRASAETLPEWHLRCTTASKAVRVRVYDRGAHCTWDSADGNEGHIQGNP